jgi:type II restriction/modification system DNA methylase subunit YeeA
MSPLLSKIYEKQRKRWHAMTLEMQQLEEENNRIFIDAYGLQDELTPNVPLKEITLTCNPYYRYKSDNKTESELEQLLLTDTIKEFLSYAVGCMFGRYSLDLPGLVLASQGETLQDYSLKHNAELKWSVPTHENADPEYLRDATKERCRFKPAWNNVIPILDGDWFTDDIMKQFKEFLRATFGEKHFDENLTFIESVLGKSVKDYFVKDFFADHLKRYKKRPIYWLFSSGRNKAFQCLIYLHRYNAATLSRMRTEYVIPLTAQMRKRIEIIDDDVKNNEAISQSNKRRLEKEWEQLKRQFEELKLFDEKLRHWADKKIELNLDDGVKVNYAKFGDLLSEVKTVTGGIMEN